MATVTLLAATALSPTTLSSQTVQLIPQPYSESSYLLDSEGMLLVWGHNDQGQLGAGNNMSANTPQRMPLPEGVSSWIAVAFPKPHAAVPAGRTHWLVFDVVRNIRKQVYSSSAPCQGNCSVCV
jgi:hypothetical protein